MEDNEKPFIDYRDRLIDKLKVTYHEYEERKELKEYLKGELERKLKSFKVLEKNYKNKIKEVTSNK
jgi:inorganic pyrophosphatase